MKIYVVGIGSGDKNQLTSQAINALEKCDIIIGYTVYIDLIKELFPCKKFMSTPMKQEKDRCNLLFEEALKGKNVAMISSGDAGIYGMASLVYELSKNYPPVEIEVVSGITAASSGGALVGAPLNHDFAVISLSDLLTPFELIMKRIRCASQADFSICIYNPSSKKRCDYLKIACDEMLKYKSPSTVCAVAKNIGRVGQSYEILTLIELREKQTDMFTTVFIGNTQTKNINGKMVTPRGYLLI